MLKYFSKAELTLWTASMAVIILSFFIFEQEGYLTLSASLIGVTSLIFAAKGNPAGPLLMIIFSLIYGVISHGFAYYGEMVTYLGMTLPMSVAALASWLKNPYKGNRAQVRINSIKFSEGVFLLLLTLAVTVVFWFILKALGTANLFISTVSVATSFAAVYLTFRRSPYYAAAYALNDIVLIVMWLAAARRDTGYLAVAICFTMFFANDLYGFVSWRKMQRFQAG